MKIGILPLGRPTFDVPFAEENLSAMLAALDGTGHELTGPRELLFDGRRGIPWGLSGLLNPMALLGGPLFGTWTLAIAGVVVAIGLFRIRKWARIGAVVLAFFGCFLLFPVGLVFSVPVIAYMMRKDIQRLFELGEGPVTVTEDEAAALGKWVR